MMQMASAPRKNSEVVARNTFWYGFEMVAATLMALITSIAMARVLGPQKLGYFNYVMWLTNMTGLIGSMGITSTTRKYMAEHLARDEGGIAKAIFRTTVRYQSGVAVLLTAAALCVVFSLGDPAHRVVSSLQVLSMLPAMLVFVPSQANAAREDFRANVFSSTIGSLLLLAGVIVSLILRWDLVGVAATFVVARSIELVLRWRGVQRWISELPDGDMPDEVRKKMRTFSGQSMLLLLVNAVVWDRSDIVLLKCLNSEIAQVSFFTVAFNLCERALVLPQTAGNAIGATFMAQYGRGKEHLSRMAGVAVRYMLLVGTPLLVALAALSTPAITLVYGSKFVPAIPVLTVAAMLAIPKATMLPAQQLLQAAEDQKFLVIWTCAAGAVNVVIDVLLIPKWGAMGAAIGNGSAQALAIVGMWLRVRYRMRLETNAVSILRITAASGVMGAVMFTSVKWLTGVPGLLVSVVAGMAALLLTLRLTTALNSEDSARVTSLGEKLPHPIRTVTVGVANWLVPREVAAKASVGV